MARRKPKYSNKIQPMKPEIRKKFEKYLKKPKEKETSVKQPKGKLWRWDTLEDVSFD